MQVRRKIGQKKIIIDYNGIFLQKIELEFRIKIIDYNWLYLSQKTWIDSDKNRLKLL